MVDVIQKRQKGEFLQSDEDNSTTWILSTSSEDRDGEVVDPSGGRFDDYRKNSAVCFNHDTDSIPIGTSSKDGKLWIWNEEVGPGTKYPQAGGEVRMALLGRCFHSKVTQQAIEVKAAVDEGVLRGCSISFVPEGAVGKNRTGGNMYRTWSMLEWSIVPVPSNPDAVRLMEKLKSLSSSEKAVTVSQHSDGWYVTASCPLTVAQKVSKSFREEGAKRYHASRKNAQQGQRVRTGDAVSGIYMDGPEFSGRIASVDMETGSHGTATYGQATIKLDKPVDYHGMRNTLLLTVGPDGRVDDSRYQFKSMGKSRYRSVVKSSPEETATHLRATMGDGAYAYAERMVREVGGDWRAVLRLLPVKCWRSKAKAHVAEGGLAYPNLWIIEDDNGKKIAGPFPDEATAQEALERKEGRPATTLKAPRGDIGGAYDEGVAAFKKGQPKSNNPYVGNNPIGQAMQNAWRDGWSDAYNGHAKTIAKGPNTLLADDPEHGHIHSDEFFQVGDRVVARQMLILVENGKPVIFAKAGEPLILTHVDHPNQRVAGQMRASNREGAERDVYAADVRRTASRRNFTLAENGAKRYRKKMTIQKGNTSMKTRKLFVKGKQAVLLKVEGDIDPELQEYLEGRGLDEVTLEEAPPADDAGMEEEVLEEAPLVETPNTTEEYADTVTERAEDLVPMGVEPEDAVEAALAEEEVPEEMKAAVKAIATKRLKAKVSKADTTVDHEGLVKLLGVQEAAAIAQTSPAAANRRTVDGRSVTVVPLGGGQYKVSEKSFTVKHSKGYINKDGEAVDEPEEMSKSEADEAADKAKTAGLSGVVLAQKGGPAIDVETGELKSKELSPEEEKAVDEIEEALKSSVLLKADELTDGEKALVAKAEDCVSAKIAKLLAEGKGQDQAAAIAYSMCGQKAMKSGVSHRLLKKLCKTVLRSKAVRKALGDDGAAVPAGYQALKAAADHLEGAMKTLHKSEQGDAMDAMEKAVKVIRACMAKAYPDEEPPEVDDRVVKEEDDEAVEMAKKRKRNKAGGVLTDDEGYEVLDENGDPIPSKSKADDDTIEQAADFMEDAAKGAPAVLEAGFKAWSKRLKGIGDDPSNDPSRRADRVTGSGSNWAVRDVQGRVILTTTSQEEANAALQELKQRGKSVKAKRLSKAECDLAKAANEYLEDVASDKGTPPRISAGARFHASSLKTLFEKVIKELETEAQPTEEEKAEMDMTHEQRQELSKSLANLQAEWTGVRSQLQGLTSVN